MRGILCFHFNKKMYGINIEEIKEIVEELPIAPLFRVPECLSGVTNLRGKILAVINMTLLFNSRPLNYTNTAPRKFIIVGDTDNREAALIVDDIVEVKWLDENSFQETPDTIDESENKYLSNLIKTGGSPIPVVDIKKLLGDELWKNIIKDLA